VPSSGQYYICKRSSASLEESTNLGHVVAKADGGHGDEDKVEGLEEGPLLPEAEEEGADQNVDDQNDERHRHGQVELVVDAEVAGGRCRRLRPRHPQQLLQLRAVLRRLHAVHAHLRIGANLAGLFLEARNVIHHLHPAHHVLKNQHILGNEFEDFLNL